MQRPQVTWTGAMIGLIWIGVIGGLVAWPATLLWQSLPVERVGAASWRELLANAAWLEVLLRSVTLASLGIALASLLAVPAAFLAERAPAIIRLTVYGAAILVFMIPSTALAAALHTALTPAGGFATIPADLADLLVLAAVYGIHNAPLLLLTLAVALRFRDVAQSEAAVSHGVGRLTAWYRFTAPQLTPAYVLGATWVALRILGDASLPAQLPIDAVLATDMVGFLNGIPGSATGAQSTVTLVVMGLLLVGLAWRQLVVGPIQTDRVNSGPSDNRPGQELVVMLFGASVLVVSVIFFGTMVGFDAATTTLAWPTPSLWRVATTGGALAVLGGIAALAALRTDPISRFVQLTLPTLLVLPPSVVADALSQITVLAPSIEMTPGRAMAVFNGLAFVAPWLILAAYVGGHLAHHTAAKINDLGQSYGVATGRPLDGIAVAGQARLLTVLFLLGTSLAIMNSGQHAPTPPGDPMDQTP